MSLQSHKPNAVSTAGTRPALSLLNNWTHCSKRLCSLSFLFLVWREKQRKERRGGPRELVSFLATPGVLSHMVTARISYHCGGWGMGSQLGVGGAPALGKELLTEVVLVLCVRGPRVQAFEGSDEG